MSSISEKPTSLAGKKIIIAGAGVAGLTFCIALRKQWASQNPDLIPPTVTIYERDQEHIPPERQGYSFSIRSDNGSKGMHTLQKLGLLDLLLTRSVSGKAGYGTLCAWDKNWKEIFRIDQTLSPGLPRTHMRIARNVLRNTLLEALSEDDTIHWETTCTKASRLENGRVKVQFSNGESDECDLLIAADGSRSKIRTNFGFDEELDYQGVVYIMGNAKFAQDVPPPGNRDYGFNLSGTGVGLFIAAIDPHSALWQLSYRSPQPRKLIKGPISKSEGERILQEALELGKDIPEPFASYVKATDLATLILSNAQDRKPFLHLTDNLIDTNVVFLGDANHAVTPFAGNGANLALMDGWDLAEQLCMHDSIEKAVKGFDELNMPRAKKVLKLSHWNIYFAHLKGWRVTFWAFVMGILVKILL